MPKMKTKTSSNGEKVATLLRIWRAAILSCDVPLRTAAEIELIEFGISPDDLRLPIATRANRPEVAP